MCSLKCFCIWLLCSLLTLTACTQPQEEGKHYHADLAEVVLPARDYTLKIPLNGDVTTLDPSLTQDTNSIELVEQLFLGLTGFARDTYAAVPELATHWTVHDDGLRYRFYLRQDVFWSDGVPVTAQDVVWTLRRNIRPDHVSFYTALLYVIKNARALHEGKLQDMHLMGVKALDDYTLEFTLEYKAAYFPKMVGNWIYRPLPQHLIARHGMAWAEPEYIETNGPYRLKEKKQGQYILLEKNPRFFAADRVNIPAVKYILVSESAIALNMYEHNELDIIGGNYLALPEDIRHTLAVHPDFADQFRQVPQSCAEYYVLNTRQPPLDNIAVRKAIHMAIDRELLVDLLLHGHAVPAQQFLPDMLLEPDGKHRVFFHPEQARAWLQQSGYPFPLRSLTLIHNVSERHHHNALAVKAMLQYYLDIDLQVESLTWDDYVARMNHQNQVDLYRLGWCGDYPDPHNWLYDIYHALNGQHQKNWVQPEFIDFIYQAGQELDPHKRVTLYRAAQRQLMDENMIILPLFFNTAQYLIKPWVKHWYAMPVGGQPVASWSLEYD